MKKARLGKKTAWVSLPLMLGVVLSGCVEFEHGGLRSPSVPTVAPAVKPAEVEAQSGGLAHSPILDQAPVYVRGAPPSKVTEGPMGNSDLKGRNKEWASLGYGSCDESTLRRLSGKALVNYLVTLPGECVNLLYRYEPGSETLYSSGTMLAVAEEAERRAAAWDGEIRSGIWPLASFLRSAYYVKADQPGKVAEFGSAVDKQVLAFINALMSNRTVWEKTATREVREDSYINADIAGVLNEATTLLNSVQDFDTSFRHVRNFFSQYARDPVGFNTRLVSLAMYGMQVTAFRVHENEEQMRIRVARGDADLLVNSMITLLRGGEKMFVDPQLYRNMIRETGRYIGYGQGASARAESAIAGILKTTKRFSPEWAEVVYTLTKVAKVDCNRYKEDRLCGALDELRQRLLPNRWVFDGGKLVVETSLPFAEVVPLYHSIKQVNASFMTVTGNRQPVDGDSNETLTTVVFGSPADYRHYQLALHNLPSDNGGMYIEQDATFYTFQRKKGESSLTLEELMRHEYVHYLAGRYLIKGAFGQSALYDRSTRMAWFDEGVAEFFAGSVSRKEIAVRPNVLESLHHDYPRVNWSPRVIMNSSYGADRFSFYHHAALWFNFLHTHAPEQLTQLFAQTRKDDVAGFDAWVARLGGDSYRAASYTNWLAGLRESYAVSPWTLSHAPEGGWLMPVQWPIGKAAVIEGHFKNYGIPVACTGAGEGPQSLVNRFRCVGYLSKTPALRYGGRLDALGPVNDALNRLGQREVTFRATECAITEPGRLECEGPLTTRQAPVSLSKNRPMAVPVAPRSPFVDTSKPTGSHRVGESRATVAVPAPAPRAIRQTLNFASQSRCIIRSTPLAKWGARVDLISSPRHGRINLMQDGRFSYVFEGRRNELDQFTVRMRDEHGVRYVVANLAARSVDLPAERCATLGRQPDQDR